MAGTSLSSIPTVVLQGGPRERGLTHGRILGPRIRLLRQHLEARGFFRHGPLLGWPFKLLSLWLVGRMDSFVPQAYREEMEAVAQGAGLRYQDVLLLNCFDDLINILRVGDVLFGGAGCSNFALAAARTAEGRLLHGRNLDYYFPSGFLKDEGFIVALLRQESVLFVYRPQEGHAFLSLSWPGIIGVVTGMNAAGLSLGSGTSYLRGATPFGMPSGLLYRKLLERCATLEESAALLRSRRITMGNNLLVASAAQDAAQVYELTPQGIALREAKDGFVATTNHFCDPTLAPAQERLRLPHSMVRLARLQEACAVGKVGVTEALALLAEESSPYLREDRHNALANIGTVQSVLMAPGAGQLWLRRFAAHPHPAGPFALVDAKALFEAGDRKL